MDFTTGSFGPLGGNFGPNVSMGGLSAFTGIDGYDYKRFSPTLGYQDPRYSLHSLGIKDTILHDYLHIPRPMGTNFAQEHLAKEEYRALSTASIGFDAAIFASPIIGAKYGGIVGGIAAPFIAGAMKDRYFDNYMLSQRVNEFTGNIRDQETGGVGLGGKQITAVSKFIRQESAKDLLLETKDIEDILKTSFNTGIMSDVGDTSSIKSKMRELTKEVKKIADLFGSEDYKGIVRALNEFKSIGISDVHSMAMFAKTEKFAAKYAGISDEAMHEQVLKAVQNAKVTGLDTRLSARAIMGEAAEMGLMQQTGEMSAAMTNKRRYLDAANNTRVTISEFNKVFTAGASEDMKKMYAKYSAEENGTTAEEEYKRLISMSNAQQAVEIQKMASRNKDFRYLYTDPNLAKAQARKVDVGNINPFPYELANAVESAKKMLGPDATVTQIVSAVSRFDFNRAEVNQMAREAGVDADEYLQQRIKTYLQGYQRGGRKGGLRELTRGDRAANAERTFDELLIDRSREKENTTLYNNIRRTFSETMNSIADVVGYGAEKVQDNAKAQREALLSRSNIFEKEGPGRFGLVSSALSGEKLSAIDAYKMLADISPVPRAKNDSISSIMGLNKEVELDLRYGGAGNALMVMGASMYENGEQTAIGRILTKAGRAIDKYGFEISSPLDLLGYGNNIKRRGKKIKFSSLEKELMDDYEDDFESGTANYYANMATLINKERGGDTQLLKAYRAYKMQKNRGEDTSSQKYSDYEISQIQKSIEENGYVPKFLKTEDGGRITLSREERARIEKMFMASKTSAISSLSDEDIFSIESKKSFSEIERAIESGSIGKVRSKFADMIKRVKSSSISDDEKIERIKKIQDAQNKVVSSLTSGFDSIRKEQEQNLLGIDNDDYRRKVSGAISASATTRDRIFKRAIDSAMTDSSLSAEERKTLISQLKRTRDEMSKTARNSDKITRGAVEEARGILVDKSADKAQEEYRKRRGDIFKKLLSEIGRGDNIALSDGTMFKTKDIVGTIDKIYDDEDDATRALGIIDMAASSGDRGMVEKLARTDDLSREDTKKLMQVYEAARALKKDRGATADIDKRLRKESFEKYKKLKSDYEFGVYDMFKSDYQSSRDAFKDMQLYELYSLEGRFAEGSEEYKAWEQTKTEKEYAGKAYAAKMMADYRSPLAAFGDIKAATKISSKEIKDSMRAINLSHDAGKSTSELISFIRDNIDGDEDSVDIERSISKFFGGKGDIEGMTKTMQSLLVASGGDKDKMLGMLKGSVETAEEYRRKVSEHMADIAGITGDSTKRRGFSFEVDRLLSEQEEQGYSRDVLNKKLQAIGAKYGAAHMPADITELVTKAHRDTILEAGLTGESSPKNAKELYDRTGGDIKTTVTLIASTVKEMSQYSNQMVGYMKKLADE